MPTSGKNIAFKEWSIVCDALGEGQQTIIFRKGGIHEGKRGFQFTHNEFLLFPTRFHEQEQKVHLKEPTASKEVPSEYKEGEQVELRYLCKIHSVDIMDQWDTIQSLRKFHIWDEPTILERYRWSKEGEEEPFISLAILRVFELSQSIKLSYEKKYGGCRSWLKVPEINSAIIDSSQPVIGDNEFKDLIRQINQIIGRSD